MTPWIPTLSTKHGYSLVQNRFKVTQKIPKNQQKGQKFSSNSNTIDENWF